MNLRYLGFEQRANGRAYRFDLLQTGGAARHCVVTADLALFLTYHVPLQEGPVLSAAKLTADLESDVHSESHELTAADFQLHSESRRLADEARAQKRSNRKPAHSATPNSPWRNRL